MTLRRAHDSARRPGAEVKGRKRGLRPLAFIATAAAVVGASIAPAFANAANPLPDSKGTGNLINATTQTNADGSIKVLTGTVVVNVGGTWNWGTFGGSTPQ